MGKKHKKHKSKKHFEEDPVEEEVVKEERLRLVLKVQKEETTIDESPVSSDEHRREKHKKKKKKEKKHKHKHDEGKRSKKRERAREDEESEPPIKKLHIKVPEMPREPSPPPVDANGEKRLTPLQLCLENLHRTLQRKDIYGIFAFPVTDAIAPNYSQVVTNPMDFSTMLYKIENLQYTSLEALRDDFILMCKNAMLYNAPDTIYYKSAEKLLNLGTRALSEDKLRKMKRSIGIIVDDIGIDDVDVDVDILDDEEFSISMRKIAEKRMPEHQRIAEQVLNASRKAAEDLNKKYNNSKIGFLRKNPEGNTSLAILNPDLSGPNSVDVNLGKLAGKLTSGGSMLSSVKDDKRNKVIPVAYLSYGPYGSFGPTYDSSLANITKEESDVLTDTYGSELGVHYAKSLQSFVKGSGVFAQNLVDRFLDALTEGSHSKWLRRQEQKEKQKIQESLAKQLAENRKPNQQEVVGNNESKNTPDALSDKETDASKIDIASLMTLSKDGIDVSFLKNIVAPPEKSETLVERTHLQTKLDENAKFLHNLKSAQDNRLLKQANDAKVPSEQELNIAEALTGNIREILEKVRPGDVAAQESVRAALGIGTTAGKDTNANAEAISLKESIGKADDVMS
ncbi:bromodomain-containing protein 7-like [Rhopilema esculentum]|uniref:bromodomain-containing protein 7-like n=1 Tax=Rhopilema esculentum TaxID=499914 RepID=UPI0031E034D1